MDWQALGTFVALLGVIATSLMAMKGHRQERVIAENTAKRAEAAARLTEHYASRVVDALESLAEGRVGVQTVERMVRWSMTKSKGDSFHLENTGGATAFDVLISGHETLIGPDVTSGDLEVVREGEAITFIALQSLGTSDITITVTWASAPGATERNEWRYPLPA